MSITKKNIIPCLLIITAGFLIFQAGCVESVTDSGGSSSTLPPVFEITSPITGDTLVTGANEVTYSVTDPSGQGISQFEVFINGASSEILTVGSSSSKYKLYLNVPDSYLFQKISYHIIAYSKSGKYKASKTQTNLYVKLPPPKAPGKLRISRVSNNEFSLAWIDSSDNEERFELWRKEGLAGTYALQKTLAANMFYTSDIVPSMYTIYFYKVRSANINGNSAFSNEVNTLIAPSNLQAKALGTTSVELTWTDNSAFEDGFRIERTNVSTGQYEWIANVPTNTVYYKDETVLGSTTYKYRVAAFTGSASSGYSNEVSITTPSSDIPPPSLLTANFNYTTRKVDLSWYSSSYNPTTYVERKEGYGGQYAQYATINSSTTRKFTDSIYTQGTLYFYRVREVTSLGLYTAYSNEDTAYVPILPPEKPTNFRLVAGLGVNEFKLFWADNSSTEDGFEIWRKDGASGQYALANISPANSIAATQYVPSSSVTYYFKVRAYRGSLFSEFSNEASTAGGLGLFNLTTQSIGTTFVALKWNDNFTDEVGYSIERKLSWQDDTKWTEVGIQPASPGTSIVYFDSNNVQSTTTYQYRVRAILNTSYSEYSNIITVTTKSL